jgi:hypothetical protein
MPGDQPDFVIRLRPLRDDYGVLPAIRLRRGLKHLLRVCGLRAIDHREVPRDSPTPRPVPPAEEVTP